MPDSERAIRVVSVLRGRVAAPPSKSATQRAIVAGSLASGRSRLDNPLLSDDTRHLARALDEAGIPVRLAGSAARPLIEIDGSPAGPAGDGAALSVGNAGTAMRFLAARLAATGGVYVIDGDARMRRRPIEDLLVALRGLGAAAESVHGDGCPPVRVGGRGLPGGRVSLPGSKSSQYLSAILLAAPAADAGVEVEVEGDAVSRPYVEMTVSMMRRFGVEVERDIPGPGARRFKVAAGQRYRPLDLSIEGDHSSAAYFFAAAAVTGGRVTVEGLDPASPQPDARFIDLLARMGCGVTTGENSVTVEGTADLTGIEADLGDLPDAAPALAVVALFARGPTRIRGAAHLRLKESDRIEAIVAGIRRLGGDATGAPDGLTIRPRPLRAGRVETRRDHRIAMAFAVAGLRVHGVVIEDPGCVAKSFPDFWERLDTLIAASA